MKRLAQRNPLLVRPPQHKHRLTEESRLTKHGWAEPHLGVHTADTARLAAGYAFSAWEQEKEVTAPVVVTLRVNGLVAEPDVDALLWWYDRGGDLQAREALRELERGRDVWQVIDSMNEGRDESVTTVSTTVSSYLLNIEANHVDWHTILTKARTKIAPALAGSRDAIRKVLVAGFPQRRYLNDFDLDRVVEIRTFKPWLDRLAPDYLDEDNEPKWIAAAEKRGLVVIGELEVETFEPEWTTLYASRRGLMGQPQYHGTTLAAVRAAFPDLVDLDLGL